MFEKGFDHERYQKVIQICGLVQDLESLPGGDLTEIGEKGINLSGGQKARISIARAAYSQSDIYLFDDPLAALDYYVAKQVFESCFLQFLKGKTVVLVTNNQQFLSFVDNIIVMDKGAVVQQGKFENLVANDGFFKNEFMINLLQTKFHDNNEKPASQTLKNNKLTESEERAIGKVNFSIYKTYYAYAGGTFIVMIGILAMLCWLLIKF